MKRNVNLNEKKRKKKKKKIQKFDMKKCICKMFVIFFKSTKNLLDFSSHQKMVLSFYFCLKQMKRENEDFCTLQNSLVHFILVLLQRVSKVFAKIKIRKNMRKNKTHTKKSMKSKWFHRKCFAYNRENMICFIGI